MKIWQSDEVGSSRPQRPWQFTPINDFLSRSNLWMYRSFVWAIAVMVILLYLFTASLFVLNNSPINAAYLVATLISGCVGSIVLVRWILCGVDLRQPYARLQIIVLLVPLLVQIWVTVTNSNSMYVIATVITAVATLLIITILGPVWMVFIFGGAIIALGTLFHLGVYHHFLVSFYSIFLWGSAKMTFWYVNVLHQLTWARHNERRLAVAEERVRFAADLHDVIGRNLSIISMQAELADQLVARGDARARDHLREVRQTAASAMTQMRSLVRGYREPTFDDELQGARRLLESAGIELEVRRSGQPVCAEAQTLLAYFVREAVTNILRHSQAKQVIVEITPERISITNDHPVGGGGFESGKIALASEGTGIASLRGKLVQSGLGSAADLHVDEDSQHFTITMELSGCGGGGVDR